MSPDEVEKSISADRTLEADLTHEADVRSELLRLTEEVGARVRHRGFVARTVGIKIRFADFRTVTRVRTLPAFTASDADIYNTAVDLYRSLRLDLPRIRLVGVKAEGLQKAGEVNEQLTLDFDSAAGPTEPARADPTAAIDAARARFGSDAVRPAALLGAGGGERATSRLARNRHFGQLRRQPDSPRPLIEPIAEP